MEGREILLSLGPHSIGDDVGGGAGTLDWPWRSCRFCCIGGEVSNVTGLVSCAGSRNSEDQHRQLTIPDEMRTIRDPFG